MPRRFQASKAPSLTLHLTLDQSTSSSRSIVFDAEGRIVADEILEPVPHGQVVCSLPRRLRASFPPRKGLIRFDRLAYQRTNRAGGVVRTVL